MSRPYNPKYDSVLGPMRDPTPPTENPFHNDNSFLSQLDPSRVGESDTEAALKNLFGDAVTSTHHDHDHHHEENQGQQHINVERKAQDDSTPTLASHDISTVSTIPLPTPPTTNVGNRLEEDEMSQMIIDPDLTEQSPNNKEGTGTPSTTTPATAQTQAQKEKRKATSRANMLARGGACEFCKKRKLKCSAELPTCSNCKKTNKECIYSQKKQRSRVRVLEDRLQELEKRLDNQPPTTATTAVATESAGTSASTKDNNNSEPNVENGTSNNYDSSDFPTLSTFDFGFDKNNDLQNEPDLMTLADAAAADTSIESESWEGLSPEIIVSEILKAISGGSHGGGNHGGGKSIGEKIVSHLIQLYISPPSVPTMPSLHSALSPSTLSTRLSNKTDRPIHPALLLSLIPFLLPLSPSTTLHSPQISYLITNQAKNSIHTAITNSDPRIIDLVASCTIRAYSFYSEAKYFEGWTETALATSMIYASGLSKLGYIGERFTSPSSPSSSPNSSFDDATRKERVDRERKLRLVLNKGVAVPPPKDKTELGERINLFWQAYMNDRGGSIGWGWPSSFNDEEITTPWPKDEYDSDASLVDNRTIVDFLNSNTPDDASKDNAMAAQAKSMTLLYHAQRLFDLPSNISTPDRTSRLMRITRGYMSTCAPITHQPVSPELLMAQGARNQVLMTLHATMCVLHAKEEIDAPAGSEKEYFDKAIESAAKVLEVVDVTQSTGDVELDGLSIGAAVIFHFLGRMMTKYIERISLSSDWDSNSSENDRLMADLNEKKEKFQNALGILGKKSRFANVASQLLENISFGSDFKLGEYERPDNMA